MAVASILKLGNDTALNEILRRRAIVTELKQESDNAKALLGAARAKHIPATEEYDPFFEDFPAEVQEAEDIAQRAYERYFTAKQKLESDLGTHQRQQLLKRRGAR